MSRSKRKTPIFGRGGTSEKQDKRINNRMFRKKERIIDSEIKKELIGIPLLDFIDKELSDAKYPIDMDEIRSTWSMTKDGKGYWGNATNKEMRK